MNWEGKVESINVGSEKGKPLALIDEVEAVAGCGLKGDRNFNTGEENFGRAATLIAAEALEDVEKETGLQVTAIDSRRNILTRGVPLNDLVAKKFRVGTVLFQGTGLCDPCRYLEKLVGKKGLFHALENRAGLTVRILEGGTIRVGDAVRPEA